MGGDNFGYNLNNDREAAQIFGSVINGANLGHFVSKMGINGRAASEILIFFAKLENFGSKWGGGHSSMSPWLRA